MVLDVDSYVKTFSCCEDPRVSIKNKRPFSYGSVEWANVILRLGIVECQNKGRSSSARILEILYYARILKEEGFWWQSGILRSHYHRALRDGLLRPKADPSRGGRGGRS